MQAVELNKEYNPSSMVSEIAEFNGLDFLTVPQQPASSSQNKYLDLSNSVSQPFVIADVSPCSPEFNARQRSDSCVSDKMLDLWKVMKDENDNDDDDDDDDDDDIYR
ncbi:hypothetical protein CANARDRAFT_6186 [[Candida] arabinofermentans NRRL YB-2248]|uniref:Uncharacterized protein n=1 Tax=[Candida] arabinofermentans NRRL YB-2248 TaxID=983967 RepID=A0A1E4T4A8_9ASCO|nr:hypothetical protein CANARDRAFT_6186 [[Candida] arabinofermentans NRRL YB-2248]